MPTPQDNQPHLWDYRWVRDLIAIMVVLVLLWLLYTIRSVAAPIVLGLGMAYVFNPFVTWAHAKCKWPRWLTTSFIMFTGVMALLLAILVLWSPVKSQGQGMVDTLKNFTEEQWPKIAPKFDIISDSAKSWFGSDESSETADETDGDTDAEIGNEASAMTAEQQEDRSPSAGSDAPSSKSKQDEPAATKNETDSADTEASAESSDTTEELAEAADEIVKAVNGEESDAPPPLVDLLENLSNLDWSSISNVAAKSLGAGVGAVGSIINTTSYLLLALVITAFCFFFFSWKFGPIIDWFKPLIPKSKRDESLRIIKMMDNTVAAFIRGRLVQALVMGLFLSVGWWFAGVPYWLLLGLLCGMLNLIPYAASLGWILAVILSVIHSLTGDNAAAEGFTWMAIVWPTVVYFAAQLFDGWVVEPIVQGQATDLDPLTVLLVVIIGGALAGLLGMLLAIPLAACVKILGKEVLIPRLREFAEGQ